MNILHIASYYISSKVYKELINAIYENNKEIEQQVYVPLKRKQLFGKNIIEDNKKIKILYSKVHNQCDRIFYNIKINKSYKDVQKKVKMDFVDFMYAYTVFADGGVAYKINKKYGIPYIIVVRNSDINGYLKKMPFAKRYLERIVKNAKKVIFISPSMKKDLEKNLKNSEIIRNLQKKSVIIPNGINEFWHESNKKAKLLADDKKLRLIQVSTLDKNKNLYATIDLVKKLNKMGYSTFLTIVGEGPLEKAYKRYAIKQGMQEKIKFEHYISDKEILRKLYCQQDIFVMLSKTETFGLVYIEAMSQGLPIIYSKNTGIDGYFKDGQVGFSIDSNTMQEDIRQNIEELINNYEKISRENIELSSQFKWKDIANKYLNLMV
ncbi:MAG: glycosyltransferase family 4 protein [Clostridia bacterium]